MSKLPTELIAEILSFLPPKSLCRFKSVAKSWQFLITSDAFIKLHLSKTLISDQPPNLMIRHFSLASAAFSDENPNEIIFSDVDHPVKHLPEFTNVEVIGSCNGILCIADELKKTVFYFNPSTKTHRLIPSSPPKIRANDHPEGTLFNPFVNKPIGCVVAYGFGYDSSVDDYKLLRVVENYADGVRIFREIRLYSLRSNSWKNVEDEFDDYPYQMRDTVHINGVLYFAVTHGRKILLIKCFDLKTEKFSIFDVFEYSKSFENLGYMLVELGGCLAVMVNYLNKNLFSKHFDWKLACADLWVRKEGSWVRVFRVSDPFIFGNLVRIRPVTYSKDGGRVLLELDGTKFCWFDWRSNKFTNVWAHGIRSKDKPFDASFTFVPSIVSLRSDEDKAKDERKDKGKVLPQKNVKKKNLDGFLSTGFKLRL